MEPTTPYSHHEKKYRELKSYTWIPLGERRKKKKKTRKKKRRNQQQQRKSHPDVMCLRVFAWEFPPSEKKYEIFL